MREIKITEENKEIYEKFYNIQKNITEIKNPIIFSVIIPIIVSFIGIGSIFAVFPWINFINNIFLMINPVVEGMNIYAIAIGVVLYVGLILGVSSSILPIMKKVRLDKFKKKYPDFDTNVDVNEIAKSLKEYQNLKKKENLLNTPIVDTKKLNSNTKLEKINIFETMTPEEKIAYLERERAFWMMEVEKQKEETVSQKHL